MSVTVEDLIKDLNNIKDKYGNIPIKVNIVGDIKYANLVSTRVVDLNTSPKVFMDIAITTFEPNSESFRY